MAEEKKVDNRRSFLGPDGETKYFVATPTAEDVRGADWQYSKTYTQGLMEGITTSSEMLGILTQRGIIGPEFEMRAQELSETLAKAITALEEAVTNEEKRELAVSVANAREELFQWNQRLNGPMNNTCEQIADDARLEFLTSSMIQDTEGNKIWDSYDNYLREKDQSLAVRARFEVMLFLQGLDSDFLDKTPEAVAMKEIEQDVVNRAEEALRAIKAADEEAQREIDKAKDDEEEKPAKKKTTRKTTAKKKSTSKKKKETDE